MVNTSAREDQRRRRSECVKVVEFMVTVRLAHISFVRVECIVQLVC